MTDSTRDATVKPPMPRWVKTFGVIGLALVLLVVGMLLLGGGEHGPGRHMPGGNVPGAETPGVHTPEGVPTHP